MVASSVSMIDGLYPKLEEVQGLRSVVDKFVRGTATSIKSINLNDVSYQSSVALGRTLQGYIDKVASFNGAEYARQTIAAAEITGRALEVAVPNAGTAAQQAAISAAVQYGASRGVAVHVATFP